LEVRAGTPQAFLGRLGILVAKLPRLLGRSPGRFAYFALRALRALGDRIDRLMRLLCEVIRCRAETFLFVLTVACRHCPLLKVFSSRLSGFPHVVFTRAHVQKIEPVAQW